MTDYKMRRQIMVDTQVRPSDVTKFPIIDALLNVPREKFVPDGKREAAYICLLYTSPSPRDATLSRMPSSA